MFVVKLNTDGTPWVSLKNKPICISKMTAMAHHYCISDKLLIVEAGEFHSCYANTAYIFFACYSEILLIYVFDKSPPFHH